MVLGFRVSWFRVSGFRSSGFRESWSVSCHVVRCGVSRFQSQVTHASVLGFHGPVLVLVQFSDSSDWYKRPLAIFLVFCGLFRVWCPGLRFRLGLQFPLFGFGGHSRAF